MISDGTRFAFHNNPKKDVKTDCLIQVSLELKHIINRPVDKVKGPIQRISLSL